MTDPLLEFHPKYQQLRRGIGWAVAGLIMLSVSGCDNGLDDAFAADQIEPETRAVLVAEPQSEELPEPDEEPTVSPNEQIAVVEGIADGDTIRTNLGSVRLIGIDTPERGDCGFDASYALMVQLVAPGTTVTLILPDGQNDTDKYDRLLRYVLTAEGVDVGLAQIEAGYAVTRYDSTDGYPQHPKEDEYRSVQRATLTSDGRVHAIDCESPSLVQVEPVEESGEWWTQYSSCKKLKQNTNGHPTGPFDRDNPDEVDIYNWFAYGTGHRGDGDGDGLACE